MPKRQPEVTEAEVKLAERIRAGIAKLAAKEGCQLHDLKSQVSLSTGGSWMVRERRQMPKRKRKPRK